MGEPTSDAFGWPSLRRVLRSASDWVDLQWSVIIDDLRAVAPRAHGRLLDVGCGDKPYEEIFRPHVSEYVGIEHEQSFSPTKAATRSGPDVLYDGRSLPFEAGSFDTILCVQVLEHTPEPQRLLAEIARVLRPDGLLILNAPFCFRLHEEPHDYFRYSSHGLKAMLSQAGLEAVEIRAQGGLFRVVGHKLNSFLAFRVGRLAGLGQSMGKLGHEGASYEAPRYWTLPTVLPAMLAMSAGARVLDHLLPDPTETLSFLVLARRASPLRESASASAA